MNTTQMLVLLLGVAGAAYVITRPREGIAGVQAGPEATKNPERPGFSMGSWSMWMAPDRAPAAFNAALHEGANNPESIVNNAFRRLFPAMTWPPDPGDARYGAWDRVVEAIARRQQLPHKPSFHVV